MKSLVLIALFLSIFVGCNAPSNDSTVAVLAYYLLVVLENNKIYAVDTRHPQDFVDVTDRFRDIYLKSVGPISATHDRILYTAMHANSREIGVVNANASREFLTTDPAADYSPIWSPDGQKVAFLSERRQQTRDVVPMEGDFAKCDLFIFDLSNHQEHSAYQSETRLSRPIWISNSSLVFAQSQAANLGKTSLDQIKQLDLEDGKITVLAEAQHDPLAMFGTSVMPIEASPDERQLLYQSNRDRTMQLQQLSLITMQKKNILPNTNGLFEVMWLDKDHLIWLKQRADTTGDRPAFDAVIQLYDLTTGSTVELNEKNEIADSPSVSPLGRQVAYISVDYKGTNLRDRNELVLYDLESHQRRYLGQVLPDQVIRIVGWVTGTWANGKPQKRVSG